MSAVRLSYWKASDIISEAILILSELFIIQDNPESFCREYVEFLVFSDFKLPFMLKQLFTFHCSTENPEFDYGRANGIF